MARILCLIAGLIVLTTACGENGNGEDGPPETADYSAQNPPEHNPAKIQAAEPGSGEGMTIGYVSLDESNEFWHTATVGVREEIRRSGATEVFCDAQGTPEGALDCVKTLKTRGVDGYIIVQQDAEASERICAAGPQDVPVISFDVLQEPCSETLAGPNNAYAGYIAGEKLGRYFKRNFDCEYDAYVSLEAFDAGRLNEERMGGYHSGFASVCGEIKDMRRYNAITASDARPVVTDVLTSLSDANRVAVVAVDDSGLVGAFAAARKAGRLDHIYGSGQNVQPFAYCPIYNHPENWVGSTGYFPEDWGKLTVPHLIDAIQGEDIPSTLLTEHTIINAGNIEKHYPNVGSSCEQ